MPTTSADNVGSTAASSGGGTAVADGGVRVPSYRVVGQPEDLEGARELAEDDKYVSGGGCFRS